jgi:hypothetical protein
VTIVQNNTSSAYKNQRSHSNPQNDHLCPTSKVFMDIPYLWVHYTEQQSICIIQT